MSQATAIIAERFVAWGCIPHAVRDAFVDPSPAGVASALDEFCERHLGATVQQAEFFAASVGSVHGLRLLDGRRVVVKVHARVSTSFLEAVQEVQRHLDH